MYQNRQFFCCGGEVLLRPKKKKFQLSVWRVVLLCQFLVLAGNRFWLYILLCTWSTIQLWCCVSFFGIFVVVAGKWFWREIGSNFVVAGNFYYDRKKKI